MNIRSEALRIQKLLPQNYRANNLAVIKDTRGFADYAKKGQHKTIEHVSSMLKRFKQKRRGGRKKPTGIITTMPYNPRKKRGGRIYIHKKRKSITSRQYRKRKINKSKL